MHVLSADWGRHRPLSVTKSMPSAEYAGARPGVHFLGVALCSASLFGLGLLNVWLAAGVSERYIALSKGD